MDKGEPNWPTGFRRRREARHPSPSDAPETELERFLKRNATAALAVKYLVVAFSILGGVALILPIYGIDTSFALRSLSGLLAIIVVVAVGRFWIREGKHRRFAPALARIRNELVGRRKTYLALVGGLALLPVAWFAARVALDAWNRPVPRATPSTAAPETPRTAFTALKERAQPFDAQSVALLRAKAGPVSEFSIYWLTDSLVGAERTIWAEIADLETGSRSRRRTALVQMAALDAEHRAEFVRYLLDRRRNWARFFGDSPADFRAAFALERTAVVDRAFEFAAQDARGVVQQLLDDMVRLGAPERLYLTRALPVLKYDFERQQFVNGTVRKEELGVFLPRPRFTTPRFVDRDVLDGPFGRYFVPARAQDYILLEADLNQDFDDFAPPDTERAWAPPFTALDKPNVLALDRSIEIAGIPVEPQTAERLLLTTPPNRLRGDGWRIAVELSSPEVRVIRSSERVNDREQETSTLFAKVERVLILAPNDEVVQDLAATSFPEAAAADR